jgi:hypothetical protein
VGFADAGRAEDEDVLGLTHVTAGGQLAHQPGVDRRLEFEVEVVEGFDGREVRDLDAHGDAFALLGANLLLEQMVEKVQVGGLATCGFGQDGVETLGHVAQVEFLQTIENAGVDEFAHLAPPNTRS